MKKLRVVNPSQLEWIEVAAPHGEAVILRKRLAQASGGRQLGCSLTRIPQGKRGWPFHWHAANEEALYVISGTARLRLMESEERLAPGDWISLPAGPEGAHQLFADGDEDFVYLAISTMLPTDMSVEPDSNKVVLFAGSAPGGTPEERTLSKFLRLDAEVDFWHGE